METLHDIQVEGVLATKHELDAVMIWMGTVLHLALGPEEGQRALETMPMIIGWSLWQAALEIAPEA
jgi:hypothetical protein